MHFLQVIKFFVFIQVDLIRQYNSLCGASLFLFYYALKVGKQQQGADLLLPLLFKMKIPV